jgi:hypothetical protein
VYTFGVPARGSKTTSPPAVVQQLTDLRDVVIEIIDLPQLMPNRSHNKSFKNLFKYIELQLSRLIAHVDSGPMDLVALATRNLIEISLLAHFVTRSKENMKQFTDEVALDFYEMFKVLDKSDGEHDYAEIEARASRVGLTGRKRIKLSRRAEDESWFKLCSKYIHPSSLSLNFQFPKKKSARLRHGMAAYGHDAAIRSICRMTGEPLPTGLKE